MSDDIRSKIGIPVQMLLPDGPAAKAGIEVGDRIVVIDGKVIDSFQDYMDALHDAGQSCTIEVMRGDKLLTLTMVRDKPAIPPEEAKDMEAVLQMFLEAAKKPPPPTTPLN